MARSFTVRKWQALATFMEQQKMDDAELAQKVGISKRTIQAYRRGEVIPPSDRLLGIADALGVTASDLSPNNRLISD